MRSFGEICLLVAFVTGGLAAAIQLLSLGRSNHRSARLGVILAVICGLTLTAVVGILAYALYVKDFRYAYVASYSSLQLNWMYSVSALWVGQAGSLLLWAWFMVVLALMFGLRGSRRSDPLCQTAFGIQLAYVCFLVAIMVFAADPMAPNLSAASEGAGLSPLLQHPAMLIHPPIVFLGYALWTVPFALAMAALLTQRLDLHWVRQARSWALLAWSVLGLGILLGAEWAYEELGWGGYWAWDPVENGSLLPWLTGTALIHGLMAWHHRQILKKSTMALALATFALCNFATFLTRSGVFSSLHAFSESPIGWLFLGLMIAIAIAGSLLLWKHRRLLAARHTLSSVYSRESGVMIASVALLLLTAVVLLGTLSMALSNLISGRPVMVGPQFYNNVLIPIGILLLATTAVVPLLRWGGPPSIAQRRALVLCSLFGGLTAIGFWLSGIRHPLGLAVAALAALSVASFVAGLWIETRRRIPAGGWRSMLAVLRLQRRQYAGFLIHLGFVCLAVGVTGSSLGKRERGFTMTEGQTVQWDEHQIYLARMHHRELPDRLIGEAELEIRTPGKPLMRLRPAQHFHRLQEQWTTEVDIHSDWSGDFYAILHSGDLDGQLYLTFVENPLINWLWAGGAIMVCGAAIRLYPTRRRGRTAKSTLRIESRAALSLSQEPSRGRRSAA
jgi:cytochrome c-type biogenesis protein CcmF